MSDRHVNKGLRKLCGCTRRTWAKCPHPWHFNFKVKGKGGRVYRFSLDRHLGREITSKADAETEADRIRVEIREGRFGQPAPRRGMTLRQLADTYMERYVRNSKPASELAFTYAVNTICRAQIPRPEGGTLAFGDWPLTDIVIDTIERFREGRRREGVGVTGTNRNLQSLRALYNWAIGAGYIESSPFKRHDQVVVKIAKRDETTRTRRLDTDEAARLLAACGPHLRAVVECALETGCRRGEILSLQWSQVEGATVQPALGTTPATVAWAPRATVFLPARKTKTKADRRIPISTRLRAILELRRFDPRGEPLPPDAYVFGNELGQQVKDVGRAWETAVLKAHEQAPAVTKTCNLTPEARAALHRIDLHFHDLRREAGSRWLDGGVPIHTVRDWLGHANVSQTSTYLAGTLATQHDAMAAFEQRAALQRIATDSQTGAETTAPAAMRRTRNARKTTGTDQPRVM